MARTESDKEDLIRDATALVERAELVCDHDETLITIGFFRDGRCTVYLNQDPFYQFDSEGRLRRAYENGLLYRSQTDTLSSMVRERSSDADGNPQSVTLSRRDLDASELHEFLTRMHGYLRPLRDHIAASRYTVRRAVTADGDLPGQTLTMLNRVVDRDRDFIAAPAAPR